MIARKARLEKIIDDVGKQPREDLITSSLFGALYFLNSYARSRALSVLIGSDLKGDANIILWPRIGLDRGTVEPDVVLQITPDVGQEYFWVVEVKWGAQLHDNQVRSEIDAVRRGACNRDGLLGRPRHLAGYTLLREERHHESEIQRAQAIYRDLVVQSISWPALVEGLDKLVRDAGDDGGLAAWARVVSDFLRGTARGSILGAWPLLVVPGSAEFTFNAGRTFGLDGLTRPVDAEVYTFNRREA